MASQLRRGFTMVEVMIVVMIIGLLMALLLPAVNSARESGRRTECQNNMRELANAVLNFESRQGRFPGWRQGGFQIGGNPDAMASWTVQMLPGLGRQDLYEQWLRTGQFNNVSLKDLLVCASDAEKRAATGPATSYIGNTGRQDELNLASGVDGPDWRANAVFLDKHCYMPQQDSSFIKNNDGLSTTLMLSESIVPAIRWDWTDYEHRAGMIFWPPQSGSYLPPKPVHQINAPGAGTAYDLARPSSNHPGGVNVIFASGNGRFLRADTSYRVYVALMTPKGAAALEPGTLTPSSNTIRIQPKLTDDSF